MSRHFFFLGGGCISRYSEQAANLKPKGRTLDIALVFGVRFLFASALFENIICYQLRSVLGCEWLLISNAYGFRQSHSTGDLRVFASRSWLAALDDHEEAHSGSLDRVWYEGLVANVLSFGSPPALVSWKLNFVSGRSFEEAENL